MGAVEGLQPRDVVSAAQGDRLLPLGGDVGVHDSGAVRCRSRWREIATDGRWAMATWDNGVPLYRRDPFDAGQNRLFKQTTLELSSCRHIGPETALSWTV